MKTGNSNNSADGDKLKKPVHLWVFIISGIALILLSLVLEFKYDNNEILCDLLKAIGEALIIGPAISYVLDLQSMVDYFKRITIKTLISNEYLKSLDRDKLLELRKQCTAKIHLQDSDIAEKGLINLDESVCELLTKPYYERYVQNMFIRKENNFFITKSIIEEYIINPLGTKISFKDFPKVYLQLGAGEVHTDHYKVLNFIVIADDNAEVDYKDKIEITKTDIDQPDIHYNSQLTFTSKGTTTPLSIDFNNSIKIFKTIEVKTPITDITYIKRVKIPVKALNIQCNYQGNDLRLVGSCFGALSFPDNKGIRVIQEQNTISIESYNWILPGDGIFIVKVPV